jgi:hypothetical protein
LYPFQVSHSIQCSLLYVSALSLLSLLPLSIIYSTIYSTGMGPVVSGHCRRTGFCRFGAASGPAVSGKEVRPNIVFES